MSKVQSNKIEKTDVQVETSESSTRKVKGLSRSEKMSVIADNYEANLSFTHLPFSVLIPAGEENIRGEGTMSLEMSDFTPTQDANYSSISTSGVLDPMKVVLSTKEEHTSLLSPAGVKDSKKFFGDTVAALIFSGNFRHRAIQISQLSGEGVYSGRNASEISVPVSVFKDSPSNRLRFGYFSNNVESMSKADQLRLIQRSVEALTVENGKQPTNSEVAKFLGMSAQAYGRLHKLVHMGGQAYDLLKQGIVNENILVTIDQKSDSPKDALKNIHKAYQSATVEEKNKMQSGKNKGFTLNEAATIAGIATDSQITKASKRFPELMSDYISMPEPPKSSLLGSTSGQTSSPRSSAKELFLLINELSEFGLINKDQSQGICKGIQALNAGKSVHEALLHSVSYIDPSSDLAESGHDSGYILPVSKDGLSYMKSTYPDLFD